MISYLWKKSLLPEKIFDQNLIIRSCFIMISTTKDFRESLALNENYFFEPTLYVFKHTSHILLIAMYTSSLACHNQTANSSKFGKQFRFGALRLLRNKTLQALKETPNLCEKTFSNTTNFHQFIVHLLNIFSSIN